MTRRIAVAAALGLAAAVTGGPARAEKEAAAQFKAIVAVERQKEQNHAGLLKWLEKNVWPSFLDCGTGKGGVAIDPTTWAHGFLFEYYPADRGNPPTAPDLVPSCYDPTRVCFRRDTTVPLERDMELYKGFPDTNECGLTSERFPVAEKPKVEVKSALYTGTITAKLKYWEKKTSFAKIGISASDREKPRRAPGGKVVTSVGYGIVVVDMTAVGTFLGKEREAEFKGPLESPNRRFCQVSEIKARSGPTCALE